MKDMLINVPNGPEYSGLEKGDRVEIICEDGSSGCGTIYNKYRSIVVLDVESRVWKEYNEQIRRKMH